MNVRDLVAKLGFQVEGAEKLTRVESALDGIKNRLNALISLEIFKDLFHLGEEFSKMAQTLQVTANNAGLTVEQLQRLQFAAGQSGISAEKMSTAMFRLDRIIYEARTGSEQAAMVFARMGISHEQLTSWKDSNDALMAISQRMSTMTDKSERMAMAIHLMGRGSKEMVDFLSKGPGTIAAVGDQFDKLGAIISGKDVTALVNLHRAFQRLEGVIEAIWASIAARFAPILEALIDTWLEFSRGFRDFIGDDKNDQFWLDLAFALGFVEGLVMGLIEEFRNLFDYLELGNGRLWEIIKTAAQIALEVIKIVAVVKLAEIAIYSLGVAFAIATSPITAVLAALSAIVFVIHEFYALATGEDTWTLKIMDWLQGFKSLENYIKLIKDRFRSMFDMGEWKESIGNFFGDLMPEAFKGMATSPDASMAGAGAAGGNYAPTTNITVNASTGASPKDIADHIDDRLHERDQRNLRELKRGTVDAQQKAN